MEQLIKDLREGKGRFKGYVVAKGEFEICYNKGQEIRVDFENPVIQKGEYNVDPTKCSKNELIERCKVLSAYGVEYNNNDYRFDIIAEDIIEKIGYFIDDYFMENVDLLEELEKWEA